MLTDGVREKSACTKSTHFACPGSQELSKGRDIDYISLSYCRTAEDVQDARRCVRGWVHLCVCVGACVRCVCRDVCVCVPWTVMHRMLM